MVRLVSGLILAAGAVAAILWLPALPLRVLVCVVAALAAREYAAVSGLTDGAGAMTAAVVGMCWLVSGRTPLDVEWMLALALAWVGLQVLFLGRGIGQAGASVFGPCYVGAPLGMLVAIRTHGGWQAAMLVMAAVVVSDSAQYYSGRAFGRHPLAPAISPKKTIEGALGGFVAGTLLMATVGRTVLPSVGTAALAGLGAAMVGLGICGDLFESRLKRTAGVKDSAALIPGHGGVLDRVDALLFVVPAFYLFLRATQGLAP